MDEVSCLPIGRQVYQNLCVLCRRYLDVGNISWCGKHLPMPIIKVRRPFPQNIQGVQFYIQLYKEQELKGI